MAKLDTLLKYCVTKEIYEKIEINFYLYFIDNA